MRNTNSIINLIKNEFKYKVILIKINIFAGKPPLIVNLYTTFPIVSTLYPNRVEASLNYRKFSVRRSLKVAYYTVWTYIKHIFFCWRLGIDWVDPYVLLEDTFASDLNIVSIVPELQPRVHLFDKTFEFVGTTLCETVRSQSQLTSGVNAQSSPLARILETFSCVNPAPLRDEYYLECEVAGSLLIYASLGTVFNNDFGLMYKIVSGFKLLLQDEEAQKDYRILIACGKDVLQKFEAKVSKEKFELSTNIVLCKSAPQIEILKRYDVVNSWEEFFTREHF